MNDLTKFKEKVISKFTENLTDYVFQMIENDRELLSSYLHLLQSHNLKSLNMTIASEIKRCYDLDEKGINKKPKSKLIQSHQTFKIK